MEFWIGMNGGDGGEGGVGGGCRSALARVGAGDLIDSRQVEVRVSLRRSGANRGR